MANRYYDGTSAYKLEQYEQYTQSTTQKQRKATVKRKKALVIQRKKLAIVISLVFVLASAFLYANAVLIQTASKASDLSKELEDIKVRNTQVSFDIASGVDYKAVEQKAVSEFGMQHPESYQNVYVDVVQSDYTELAKEEKPAVGLIEAMISKVQSFLAYIR